MCFPIPGPRCSHHAYKDFVAAQKYLAEITADTGANKLVLAEAKKNYDTKLAIYEATPQGINELRRERDKYALDSDEWEPANHKWGEAVERRKNAMDAYKKVLLRKDNSIKEKTNMKLTKYQFATATGKLILDTNIKNVTTHILSDDTILLRGHGKILVLPLGSYSKKWGEAVTYENRIESNNSLLDKLAHSREKLLQPDNITEQTISAWFLSTLKKEGYIGYYIINEKTGNGHLKSLESFNEQLYTTLKFAPRTGGTTKWVGTQEELKKHLDNTVFSGGEIFYSTQHKKMVVLGLPQYSRKQCAINDSIFLSWKESPQEGGFYEVRKRHETENWDVTVKVSHDNVIPYENIYDPVLVERLGLQIRPIVTDENQL